MNYELSIAWLYPDLMSTYGDRGNSIVLQKRCEWRKIATRVTPVTLETQVRELERCDLIFMGGAQDRQQKIATDDFIRHKGPVIKKMVDSGVPALFVCAAYQFVGHYYKPYRGENIAGAGIFDLYTEHPGDQAKRLIGNVVAEVLDERITYLFGAQGKHVSRITKTIVGFENHGGRTYLGPKMKPLAKVIKGYGNNGADGYEGAVYKNSIGSYFHGPLLTKNPHITDWLIAKALEVKYKKLIPLAPLDDRLEWQAHEFLLNR